MRRLVAVILVACAREPHQVPALPPIDSGIVADVDVADTFDAGVAQRDPDGDDDAQSTDADVHGKTLKPVRVGAVSWALPRVCDLTELGGALYMAQAFSPLGVDGATVVKFDEAATPMFKVAFDWNRMGEPREGGGGGQGFVRVHAIGGRLFVPDADPPYDGFGLADHGTEGYVFVSDAQGTFAKPRQPHFRPPGLPIDGGAGASLVPRAYHVLDTIHFRDQWIVAAGSVPPTERAWRGAAPGALHVADATLSKFVYAVDYPHPWDSGVHRITFMVRFKDALYAGLQDYDRSDTNDLLVVSPPKDRDTLKQEDVHAVRVSERGGTYTLRFYADRGTLYWIGIDRDGRGVLRKTEGGDAWSEVVLPSDAGRPSDIVRAGQSLVVLTETALYELGTTITPLAAWADQPKMKKEMKVDDAFCAPPLAVFKNALYAGGQTTGSLYRFE